MYRACLLFVLIHSSPLLADEIAKPSDAPLPLSPEKSISQASLPPGYRLEVVASEPLIHEPSGACWDEHGRMFVTELHGYNLEGQLDIEELNKSGKLDREVRRIQAEERFKEAAQAGTYGTVKLLLDTNGDGRMDKAEVWADKVPPCYGLCAARGGIVIACAPDILYLADLDGDNRPEVREKLFTGFETGALERGINSPTPGLDGWIYVGRGRSGTVHGPRHPKPVTLPQTDFRILADGSAIEPVVGSTGTYGFTFTEGGDRFVISTRTAGIYVAPIEWRYLARNPDVPTPGLEVDATPSPRVYPISKPHPWRTRRAEDPGFSQFYSDRYGAEEASPNGYFTSACSPLVYQDAAIPELRGHLLACEPAQNLIHRAVINREGMLLRLTRPDAERESEFLASRDAWFHPIALSHGPDGAVWIVDFYREIIEDYSAIPRYLQQLYGVVAGQDRGRILRLVHESMPDPPPSKMSDFDDKQLTRELASEYSWRQQTAQRLLVERRLASAAPAIAQLLTSRQHPATAIRSLYTLSGLDALTADHVLTGLNHPETSVRIHALRLGERWLESDDRLMDRANKLAQSADQPLLFQLALSLGECRSERSLTLLAQLAREHADVRWMPTAILSSLAGRSGAMLHELVSGETSPKTIAKAGALLEPLSAAIGSRRDAGELSSALATIHRLADENLQRTCLFGLVAGLSTSSPVAIHDEAKRAAKSFAQSSNLEIRRTGLALVRKLHLEDERERTTRLAKAQSDLLDIQLPLEQRLAAVVELSAETGEKSGEVLLAAFPSSTPEAQGAILSALLNDKSRILPALDAIASGQVPISALSSVQRAFLLENKDQSIRDRAKQLFQSVASIDPSMLAEYKQGLEKERDSARGGELFRQHCGTCHQAHGTGVAVGPDLSAEFLRAEETILQDILSPSASITAGYTTYTLITTDGRVHQGLLAQETAASITLRQPEGKEQVLLRKDIDELKSMAVSLMPEDLARKLSPEDVADVIAWVRAPSSNVVLVDDNDALAAALVGGDGSATFTSADRYKGQTSLRITPLQRHSPSIPGWSFPIREKPGPGEFRYLRFAWKSDGARGVMMELADRGRWPQASQPRCRYHAGANETAWQSTPVGDEAPADWTVVTRDLWKDFGDMTLTGIAPTAIGGPALFDRIELLAAAE